MLTYKEALEHSHISLTTMARLIGISKQSLHQKINYERPFKDDELMRFCKETRQKPSNLLIKGYNC